MRATFVLCLVLGSPGLGAGLPILGYASMGVRVTDLDKSAKVYRDVLGYEDAFHIPGEDGGAPIHFYKINDSQFIEISADLKPGQDDRMTHIALQTSDVKGLRKMLVERGLDPSPLHQRGDGTLTCYVTAPEDQRILFVQYTPDSLQMKSRGRFLGPNRLSTHLIHEGVTVGDLDVAMAFYRDKLGFQETYRAGRVEGEINWVTLLLPGEHSDFIEYITHFNQPLSRAIYGTTHHMGLEVIDIQAAYRISLERRKMADEEGKRPKLGKSKSWVFQIFDPDGTRIEPQMRPTPAVLYE